MSESEQTSFANRLAAVWLTWRTRPLVWLLGLAYVIAAIGIVASVSAWNRPPDFERTAHVPGNPQAVQMARRQWEADQQRSATPRAPHAGPSIDVGLPAQAMAGRQLPKPEKVRSITIYDDPDPEAEFWQPGYYPRVDAITVYSELPNDRLRKLLELYDVRSLSLIQSHKIDAETLEILAREETLEYLQLSGSLLMRETKPLGWPRNLRSLTVSSYWPLPSARLTEWRALRQLHTLQWSVPRWTEDGRFPDAVVNELAQYPALTTLYLDEMPSSDQPHRDRNAWATIVQPQFSWIAVRPTSIPRVRIFVGILAFVLSLLGTSLGAIHLSGFGVTHFSRLAPQATVPHAMMTALWWTCVAVISAAVMVWQGTAWPAALALAGSGPPIYGLLMKLFSRTPAGQAAYANFGLAVLPAIFAMNLPIVGTTVFEFAPPVAGGFDWFLRGQWPLFTTVWLTVDILAAWWLLERLSNLVRDTEAAGLHGVPLSAVDMAGWNRAVAPLTTRNYEQAASWNPIFRGREQRLETVLDRGPIRTRQDRLALWKAGSLFQPRDFAWIALFMGVVQGVIFGLMRSEEEGWDRMLLPMLASGLSNFCMMFLVIPFIIFWQRRKFLACELLRPVSRNDWATDWWQMQAQAFSPAICLGLVAVVLIPWTTLASSPNASIQMGLALLVLAGVALLWAFHLWTNTFSLLKAGLIALGCFVTAFTVPLLVMMTLYDKPSNVEPDPAIVLPLLLGLLVVATAIITWLAVRRWQTWELGRIE